MTRLLRIAGAPAAPTSLVLRCRWRSRPQRHFRTRAIRHDWRDTYAPKAWKAVALSPSYGAKTVISSVFLAGIRWSQDHAIGGRPRAHEAAISQKALQFSRSTSRRDSLRLPPAIDCSRSLSVTDAAVEYVNTGKVFNEDYRVRGTLRAAGYTRSSIKGERSVCAGVGDLEKS